MTTRKRLLIFLSASTLLLSACVTARVKPAPLIFSDWQLEKRVVRESSKNPVYEIRASYPEVLSQPSNASTKEVNQLIRRYIAEKIAGFKTKVPRDNLNLQDFPPEMRRNSFHINYSAKLIKPEQHSILSLRFETEMILMGEPHRQHEFAVLNYDLTAQKMLTLESLFKPASGYLTVLAKYCRKELADQLTSDMPWLPSNFEATQGKLENFSIWNAGKKGLSITFQEPQVSPYSSLPVVILVPYSVLRNMMAEDTPLMGYAY